MNKYRIFKIVLIILTMIIFSLSLEWFNIKSYYKDEVETREIIIKMKPEITPNEKKRELNEVNNLGNEIKNEMLIVKWLIIVFSIAWILNCRLFLKQARYPTGS